MSNENIDVSSVEEEMQQYEYEGKTAMIIAAEGKLRTVAVLDTVKDTAKNAVAELHNQGLQVIMLTGTTSAQQVPLPVQSVSMK